MSTKSMYIIYATRLNVQLPYISIQPGKNTRARGFPNNAQYYLILVGICNLKLNAPTFYFKTSVAWSFQRLHAGASCGTDNALKIPIQKPNILFKIQLCNLYMKNVILKPVC